MSEIIKHTGYWWLPRKTEYKIPGQMRFSLEEGVSLELYGNFNRDDVDDPRGFNILGLSSFGEPITIYQAFFQSSKSLVDNPSAGRSAFIASRAFVGAHFNQMEDAKFKMVSFQPSCLDKWLNLSIMDFKVKKLGFSLTYSQPEILQFNPINDLQIRIGFESTGPNIGSTETNISFIHSARLIIELPEEVHFNFFSDILSHLTNLIALAIVAPVRPVAVDGWILDPKSSDDSDIGKRVQILLPLYISPQEEQIYPFEMLFTYSSIKDRFGTFLANWFKKRDALDPVFDLFFGVLYNGSPYPVTTFLNYVQAIETYHIRTMLNEVDPPKEHKQRMRSILNAVPTEYGEWLTSKLAFSNSPTLAQRLKDVINFYPFPVSGQAGSHDVFIRRVKDTRNYYTHYDPSLAKKAEKGGYLKGLSMTLGTLIEGLLLYELGFNLDEVKNMQRNRRRLPSVWF